jgi:hypothetical protein
MFIGGVLALQSGPVLAKYGLANLVGGVVAGIAGYGNSIYSSRSSKATGTDFEHYRSRCRQNQPTSSVR